MHKGSFRRQGLVRTLPLFATALLPLVQPLTSRAGILYWDATPTAANGTSDGGAGVWDALDNLPALNEWDTGTAYAVWNNLTFDTAVFGGTADTVTLAEQITVGGIQVLADGYVFEGNTLNFDGATPLIHAAPSVTAHLNVPLASLLPVVKTGAGTVELNAGNVFLNSLVVSAGTVLSNNANGFGSSTVTLGDAASAASPISLLLTAAVNATPAIIIPNTGTGVVTIGTTEFSPGAVNTQFSGNISLEKDVTIQAGSADRTTFAGQITGTGNVRITSPTLGRRIAILPTTLPPEGNNFAGNVTLDDNAVLQLGVLSLVSNRGLPDSAVVNFNLAAAGAPDSNAELRFAPGNAVDTETIGALQSGPGGKGLVRKTTGTGVFTFVVGGGDKSGVYLGTIGETSGKLAFTKTGTGTQTLGGVATYTGATTVEGGILEIATGGSIAAGSAITVNPAGTLKVSGSGILNSTAISIVEGGLLDVTLATSTYTLLAGQTLTLNRTSSGVDINGPLSVGTGILALGPAGTFVTGGFSGPLTLSGSTVTFDLTNTGNDQIVVNGTVNVSTPSTLALGLLNGPVNPGTYVLLSATALTGAANLTLGGVPTNTRQTYTLDTTSNPNKAQVVVSGSGSDVVWTGSTDGTWNAGAAGTPNWKIDATQERFYNLDGVTFDDTATTKAIVLNTTVTPRLMLVDNSAGNNYTIAGSGSISGPSSLVKRGAGSLSMTPTNSYTGGTIVVQGDLISTNTDIGAGSTAGAGKPFGTGTIQVGDVTTGAANTAALRLAGSADLANPIVVTADGTGTAIIGTFGTGAAGNASALSGPITLNRPTTFESTVTDQFLIRSPISGNVGTITVQGGKRMAFVGANTFAGNVEVRGTGTILQVNAAASLPAGTGVDVGAGAFLQLFANVSITNLTGAGTVRPIQNSFTLTIAESGSLTGPITNNGAAVLSIVKSGFGNLALTSTGSTYTGETTINSGTVELSGSLAGTSKVTLNSGATLLLGGSGNRINNAAAIALNGGTIVPNGTLEGDATTVGLGALTVSNGSILDFGEISGAGLLHFGASQAAVWTSVLSIYNWNPETDRLFFGTDNTSLTIDQLALITFYSDTGFTALGAPTFTSANIGELIAIPEPSAIATLLGGVALLGLSRRRR